VPDLVTLFPDESLAALTAAREEIDRVLWRRDVRADAAKVAQASRLLGGRASAQLEGADLAFVEDSAMGKTLAAALAITAAVPEQVDTWARAPLQVLAHLHTVVARITDPSAPAGRPRDVDSVDDPLMLGSAPTAAQVGERLRTWMQWWSGPARDLPALGVAAVSHAEFMVWRPFAEGSSLIARALMRVIMAERGVDPALFTIPEEGMMRSGRPAYRAALIAYREGNLNDYVMWAATAIASGAQATSAGVPGETQGNGA